MNDRQRQEYVDNDEGLYDAQRRSGQPRREWVRENRALIDEVIENVASGKNRQHYLKYGLHPIHRRLELNMCDIENELREKGKVVT
jgi:hypothetical protein